MIAALPSPFRYTFFQHALVASVIVGTFAPLIGTFLVQKRLSLIGDGIGHVAFAGVGAGVLLNVWPVWTALLFAVAGAVAVDRLRARGAAPGDLALALLFYSGIALGVVLVSRGGGLDANVLTYLFGQPLTVTDSEIWVILLIGGAIVLTIWALHRAMFAVVTDEEWARVAGLPVDALNSVLAALTAAAVVAAMRIVGILLVAALMVLPVASAQVVGRSFRGTLRWAIAVGIGSAVAGLIASNAWDLAPSGSIVLVAAVIFAAVAIGRRVMPRGVTP